MAVQVRKALAWIRLLVSIGIERMHKEALLMQLIEKNFMETELPLRVQCNTIFTTGRDFYVNKQSSAS
jgi:hypothetical protein